MESTCHEVLAFAKIIWGKVIISSGVGAVIFMTLSFLRRTFPASDSSLMTSGAYGLRNRFSRAVNSMLIAVPALLPSCAWACACGCGIYEVGTSAMLPAMPGEMVTVEYDYQDQNQNWAGTSSAPAENNNDKNIRTTWYTLAYQDMVSRSWGFQLEVPYERRHFETTGGASGDDLVSLDFRGMGDLRIEGLYTGFSGDMSQGLTFGLKLPTGSYTHNDAYGDIDRDTEIGSGSTDLLFGWYNRFDLGADWQAIGQAYLDLPVLTQVQYRPGAEFDTAVGAYYTGFKIGGVRLSPIGLLKLSLRSSDSGVNSANPVASGFVRLFAAPGLELDYRRLKVFTDVELPLYYDIRGNQLVARSLVRLSVSAMF